MRRKLTTLLAAGVAMMALAGCYVPPWEMRTYVGPQAPGDVYTDDSGTSTWQWNMSKVRGRWVCPECGYSCDTVPVDTTGNPVQPTPYCPEPWANHTDTRLVYQPVERCFLASTDRPIRNPNGVNEFAILGKPFHPTTSGDTLEQSRSYVHVAVAGLHENRNILGDSGTPDASVRFLFIMPGAHFPAAKVKMATGDDGIGIGDNNIHINPWRVTNGEVYHIQVYQNWGYVWTDVDGDGGVDSGEITVTERHIAVRMYSSLDGLVSFVYTREEWTPPRDPAVDPVTFGPCNLLADTGSVRVLLPQIDLPTPADFDAAGPLPSGNLVLTKVTTFTIVSNSQIIPGPLEHVVTDPTDWTAIPTDWPWDGDAASPPTAEWPLKQNYISVPSDGRVADWVSQVVGTGQPVQNPYLIPEGAVGKGWVVALWQRATTAPTIIQDGINYQTETVGANDWIWKEQAEWHYDWLTESAAAAAYEHLWSNNNAVAHGEDLANDEHEPIDSAGHFRPDDPPPFVACAFISSRLQVPPTGSTATQAGSRWVKTTPPGQPTETDQSKDSGHAVVVVGEVNGTEVRGSYEPGTRTVWRRVDFGNRQIPVVRCSGCFSQLRDVAPGQPCPYCGTNLESKYQSEGYASAIVDIDVPPGVDLLSAPRSSNPGRVAIPDGCLEQQPHAGWYGAASQSAFQIAFDLPKYLPPSVPPGVNPAVNDLANDEGYRGRLVLTHRPSAAEQTPQHSPGVASPIGNQRWDAVYRCSACGTWHTNTGTWNYGTGGACQNGSCSGTKACPVCAIFQPQAATECAYCGHTLETWGPTTTFCGLQRITPADIDCEEYEPFEVIVSVLRKMELGSRFAGIDLGRVAPGVMPGQPDTTVGGTVAARPEPSDVSPAAPTAVTNEGNVTTATTPRGTNLNRAGVDPEGISRPAEAVRSPVTVGTLRAEAESGATVGDLSPLLAPTQNPGGAEGYPAAVYMTAGWSLPASYKPVPLGQPAGTHTGMTLFFQDLNGNAALDFYDVSAGVVTNTDVAVFEPGTDLPLEPVTSLDVRLRVAETPLPDNDYFAGDFWPSLVFGYDGDWLANRFQYVAGSNRPPAAAVGDPAGPNLAPDPNLANRPHNLFYGAATLIGDPGDPMYRGYAWRSSGGNLDTQRALTADTATGTVNGAPNLVDTRLLNNSWTALWHRTRPTANGVESTLRYNVTAADDYAASGEGFMFSGALVAGLRSLVANNETWLFWHSGQPGQEQLYYLEGFNPAAPASGSPLPVSNSFGNQPQRERWPVSLSAYKAAPLMAHKPSLSPFVYTKDPCAWTSLDYYPNPTDPDDLSTDLVLNVAFTGYTRHEENADICWVKYSLAGFGDPAANWGKKAFPRLADRLEVPHTRTNPANASTGLWVGEELKTDMRRQVFAAQHMDWVAHDVSDNDNLAVGPDFSREDPRLWVAVVTDVYNDGLPPKVSAYYLTWSGGRWDRSRNAYLVEPVFNLSRGGDVLAPMAFPGDTPGACRLVDPPTAPQPNPQPLMLEINLALGRVRFSSPLFNAEAAGDTTALVNTVKVANATDVRLYADYTPMIWRVTRDPADDDCPWVYSAAWSSGSGAGAEIYDHGYLAFFWRRTHGASAVVPLPGNTEFLYKLWAPSVQVQRPPFAPGSVRYWTPSGYANLTARFSECPATGVIVDRAMTVSSRPRGMRVEYTDGTGRVQQEGHALVGWSQERRVPVETELSVGPFTVRPEVYLASDGATASPAIKFWLIWTSPRALLDLRPVANGGGGIRQSADVYLATVIPDLVNTVPEPISASIPASGT